jgi:hypothetical protein
VVAWADVERVALSLPETHLGAAGYSRTVVMARLAALDEGDLRDVLLGSWRARAAPALRKRHAEALG